MNKLKTYIKYMEINILLILILNLLVSTLYYFNIISSNVADYIKPLVTIVSIFIMSLKLGKNSEKQGYLEGLKYGLLMILFITVISLIFFREDFKYRLIIYDIILIAISILGSMIGISKKSS